MRTCKEKCSDKDFIFQYDVRKKIFQLPSGDREKYGYCRKCNRYMRVKPRSSCPCCTDKLRFRKIKSQKEHVSDYKRKYYLAHQIHIRKYQLAYYYSHRKQQQKDYYEKNKEPHALYMKKYYEEHAEQLRKKMRAYSKRRKREHSSIQK